MKPRILLPVLGLLLILAGGTWTLRHHRNQGPAGTRDASMSGAKLFEPGDPTMKILVRHVELRSGKAVFLNMTIHKSKSTLSRLKQAVLAYLGGPRSGDARVPVPEGMALQQVYLTERGTAVVDLSLEGVDPKTFGFYEEALFLRGLIELLSRNFFEVKAVRVLVDGKQAPSLAGHYALGASEE